MTVSHLINSGAMLFQLKKCMNAMNIDQVKYFLLLQETNDGNGAIGFHDDVTANFNNGATAYSKSQSCMCVFYVLMLCCRTS